MTFLPIVERELRVAARRRGTYWSRLVAALLGLALAAWVVLANRDVAPQELGNTLFQTLSGLVFLYAIIVGTQVTSDCLSEEKREGTLGLLFLTDLKGYDVVFGKLAATSINAFYGMLAVVPALAIPLLLGGVTNGEFWRVVLVCVNLLLFTLAIGIFASAVCRSDHRALALAVLLAGLIILGPPIGLWIGSLRSRASSQDLMILSPGCDCFFAFDELYKGKESFFWTNIAITQIYCWGFLLLACLIVPRSWQDATAGGAKAGWWRQAANWLEGGPAKRLALRRKLLAVNPFLWRAGRSRFKNLLIWAALAVAGGLWAWTHQLFRDDWFDPGRCIVTALGLHLLFKIWLAFEAGRHLSEDRRSGAMELLLSTPLKEWDIVRGQRLALWRQFGWPMMVVLLADLVFLLAGMSHEAADRAEQLSFYLVIGIFFVLDLLALSWVGMWLGLSGRKSNRAAMIALARIILLPSVVFFSGLSCAAVLSVNFHWVGSLVFWCLLGLVANVVFSLGAKGKLLGQFRDVVAQRFGGTKKEKAVQPLPAAVAP